MTDLIKDITEKFELTKEIESLKRLISFRIQNLNNNIPNQEDIVEQIYNATSAEQEFLYQRIMLSLGLMTLLKPQFFNIFHIQRSYEYPTWVIGGFLDNGKFYPTIQTFLFLIEGVSNNNYHKRIELLKLLDNNAAFYQLIELQKTENDHNNLLNQKIKLRKEILSHLINQKPYAPEYDPDFAAQKLTTKMTWDDLVLSYELHENIEEIINWAKYGQTVLCDFKLGRRLKRGYRVLFYGPSGTGKTLTATLIGQRVGMEVYRINTAQITSKYVGETEKNLERVFEYAEGRNWILFFDEADALFGKRTSTKSSNDRYANQQIAYLLQRIEDYPGIIILASNKKGEMDAAFIRRFQLMLEFDIPDLHQRLKLWEKGLDEDFELDEDVDLHTIAEKYEITGGILINILRTISIVSLQNNSRLLTQKILLEAIKREFEKIGKTFNK